MPFWRPRGCVLWLDFLEPSGSVAYDKSGYGNHGTVHGAQRVRSLGRWGLEFDGVDDYVEVPHKDHFVSEDLTVEVLAKALTTPDNYRGVVAKSTSYGPTGNGWNVAFTPGEEYNVNWYDADGVKHEIQAQAKTGRWYHVVLRHSVNGELAMFLNAALVGSTTAVGIATNTYSLTIGARSVPDRFFPGVIAFVRVYNRALTPREIKASYAYFFSHLKGEV